MDDKQKVKAQFAAAALSGLLARNYGSLKDSDDILTIIKMSWDMADMMYNKSGGRLNEPELVDLGPGI